MFNSSNIIYFPEIDIGSKMTRVIYSTYDPPSNLSFLSKENDVQ